MRSHLRFFKGMPPFGQGRTHHVHIVESSNHAVEHRILFRDILRNDTKIRLEYENLKLELSQRYPDDRETYTKEKTTFIQTILRAYGSKKLLINSQQNC